MQFIGHLVEALFLPGHQDEVMMIRREAATQGIANTSGRSGN